MNLGHIMDQAVNEQAGFQLAEFTKREDLRHAKELFAHLSAPARDGQPGKAAVAHPTQCADDRQPKHQQSSLQRQIQVEAGYAIVVDCSWDLLYRLNNFIKSNRFPPPYAKMNSQIHFLTSALWRILWRQVTCFLPSSTFLRCVGR